MVRDAMSNRTAFAKYVRSSSGPIIIVVMALLYTLYTICLNRELIETHGRAIKWPILDRLRLPKPVVEKSPFKISVDQFEVDENVNKAHFRIHWLTVKNDAMNIRTAFTNYLRSSSSPITIVVMTCYIRHYMITA